MPLPVEYGSRTSNPVCVGSIPTRGAKQLRVRAVVARLPHKQKVGGANPSSATKQCPRSSIVRAYD